MEALSSLLSSWLSGVSLLFIFIVNPHLSAPLKYMYVFFSRCLVLSTVCIVAVLFLEFWKRAQYYIDYDWDMLGYEEAEVIFLSLTYTQSPSTYLSIYIMYLSFDYIIVPCFFV